MRCPTTKMLTSMCLLLPLLAAAQDAANPGPNAPPPPMVSAPFDPAPAPRLAASPPHEGANSFGAGLRFGALLPAGTVLLGFGPGTGSSAPNPATLALGIPSRPVPQLTFEHRLGERVALLAGVLASYGSDEIVPDDTGNPYRGELQSGAVSVTAGARVAVTAPDAPVELSGYAALNGGYAATQARLTQAGTSGLSEGDDLAADLIFGGLELGVFAEKRLGEGLSVRIGTSLVEARYSDGFAKVVSGDSEVRAKKTSLSAGLAIAPSLELRLAF